MYTFTEFLIVFNLRNKATSNTKLLQVFQKIGLDKKVGILIRDDTFSRKSGINNLHPTKGTYWVCYRGKYFFDSYGCAPPKNVFTCIKSKHGKCVYSEYRLQKIIAFVVVIVYIICLVCFCIQWN